MQARAQEVLAFVRQHGRTHPRDVQAHFDHGRIKRWGGDLTASTHLLEGLHSRGLLRVEGMRGRSWVATHIDACFACRFRLPIAIGDSVVRGIDHVDP